jgi:copper oxidase (laccase) domain-containing protein
VGAEVRQAFLQADADCDAAFRPNERGRWLCDLGALARRRLAAAGVTRIADGTACTYEDAVRFYSYRREQPTGRMAALLWIAPDPAAENGVLQSAPLAPDWR